MHLPQTEFARLLRTNEPPSETEAQCVKSFIVDTLQSLATLDEEISHAQNILSRLLARRDTCRAMERSVRNILTPIRRVPTEVFIEIFRYLPPQFGRPNGSPQVFCQVSSRWRQIAINAPVLWTSIKFEPTPAWDAEGARQLQKMWLSRAAGMPINLETAINADVAAGFRQGNPLRTITPALAQVQSLRIHAPPNLVEDFLSISDMTMDFLQSLSLSTCPAAYMSGTNIFPTATSNLFTRAPKLSQIFCDLNNGHINPFLLNLPWVQLTIMHFYDVQFSVTTVLDLLARCPNVEDFIVCVDTDDEISTLDRMPFTLHKLQSLELNLHSAESINLFRPLVLPHLTNLEIVSDGTFTWSQPVFMDLHTRSCFSLGRLWLHNVPISVSCLLEILALSPSLKTLYVLDSVWLTDRLVRALTCWDAQMPNRPRVGRTTLVPNLSSLTLRIENVDDPPPESEPEFSYEGVMSMLESRWWPCDHTYGRDGKGEVVACLREFNVCSPGRFSDKDECDWSARFQKLVDEGLLFTFTEEL